MDNSAASINLDNLVDGEIPYQVCITKEGDDEPTCSDLRSDGQANASINFCAKGLAGKGKERKQIGGGGHRQKGGGMEGKKRHATLPKGTQQYHRDRNFTGRKHFLENYLIFCKLLHCRKNARWELVSAVIANPVIMN